MEIKEFLDKSEAYLKENLIIRRSFIQNLCIISAAIAAFSIPLFFSPYADPFILFASIILLLIVIIIGMIYLKNDLEYENDTLVMMREAVLTENKELHSSLIKEMENRKGKKTYALDWMTYLLSGGIVLMIISLGNRIIPKLFNK